MKQVINGSLMFVLAFFVLATVMTVSGRSVRKNELEKSVEHAAEQTVGSLLRKENRDMSREEFIEMFTENLSMEIESDSEVIVSIMGADPQKGILSVRVEEEFHNPLGKMERVQSERTVMLEEYCLRDE